MKRAQLGIAVAGGIVAVLGGLSLLKSKNRLQTRIRAVSSAVGLTLMVASFFVYKNPID